MFVSIDELERSKLDYRCALLMEREHTVRGSYIVGKIVQAIAQQTCESYLATETAGGLRAYQGGRQKSETSHASQAANSATTSFLLPVNIRETHIYTVVNASAPRESEHGVVPMSSVAQAPAVLESREMLPTAAPSECLNAIRSMPTTI